MNNFYNATQDLLKLLNICAQCAANATTNYAGGYPQLALECIQYCRNGHRETVKKS